MTEAFENGIKWKKNSKLIPIGKGRQYKKNERKNN